LRQGRDDTIFSDHTDIRPTMMALVGLTDDYVHDGRVLVEKMRQNAIPDGIRQGGGVNRFAGLAALYKQLNAAVGSVGLNSLAAANHAITSDDTTYAQYLTTFGVIATNRDALANQIKGVLNDAAFAGKRIDDQTAAQLGLAAQQIIDQV